MESDNKHSKTTLTVSGMHCAACELLLERKLSKIEGIKSVKASLSSNKIDLVYESTAPLSEIKRKINYSLSGSDYSILEEDSKNKKTKPGPPFPLREYSVPLSLALLLVFTFYLLEKSGLVNFFSPEELSLPSVFIIGILASFSSCAAVVGSLVLSISSTFAMSGHKRAMGSLHASRLVTFFMLGGLLGFSGSRLELNSYASFILSLLLFLSMVVMALSMLSVSKGGLHKLNIKMPKLFGNAAFKLSEESHWGVPVLVGFLTFFLPCGFTQAMQLYALSTGNFLAGALTMFIFALGTFPVLGAISFLSVRFSKTAGSGVFFKTTGFIVLFFALINFYNSLKVLGF